MLSCEPGLRAGAPPEVQVLFRALPSLDRRRPAPYGPEARLTPVGARSSAKWDGLHEIACRGTLKLVCLKGDFCRVQSGFTPRPNAGTHDFVHAESGTRHIVRGHPIVEQRR